MSARTLSKKDEKVLQKVRGALERVGKELEQRAAAAHPLPLLDQHISLVQGAAALPSETRVVLQDVEPLFAMFDHQMLDPTETVAVASMEHSMAVQRHKSAMRASDNIPSNPSLERRRGRPEGFGSHDAYGRSSDPGQDVSVSVKDLVHGQTLGTLSVHGKPQRALCSLAATITKDSLGARVVALWILRRLVDPRTNRNAGHNVRLILEALARTTHERKAVAAAEAADRLAFPAPPGAESAPLVDTVASGAMDDVLSATLDIIRQRKNSAGELVFAAARFLAEVACNYGEAALRALDDENALDEMMIFLYHLPKSGPSPSGLVGVDIEAQRTTGTWVGPSGENIPEDKFTPVEQVEVQVCRFVASYYRRDEYHELIHQRTDLHKPQVHRDRSFTSAHQDSSAVNYTGESGISHKMTIASYRRPTFCGVCGKLLKGLRHQGLNCAVCGFNCHKKKCLDVAPKNCRPEVSLAERRVANVDRLKKSIRTSTGALDDFLKAGTGGDEELAHGKNKVLACMLKWATVGLVPFHQEIKAEEIERTAEVYSSALCKVFQGTYRGRKVAIKEFDSLGMSFDWDEFYKEIALQRATRYPKIVAAHGACSRGEHPFIVMDYFENGSLHKVVSKWKRENQPVDFRLITSLLIDCASSLAFLHSHNIIHRDIKTANFLVDDNFSAYVMDFGVSRVFEGDKSNESFKMTLVGTPVWMAPEVMSDLPYTGKADVYSFALVMWQLVSRDEPFKSVNQMRLNLEIIEKKRRPEIPDFCLPELAELMKLCWHPDPAHRPSFEQIVDFLYAVIDPVTNDTYASGWHSLSEAVLSDVLSFMPVKDMFVCSGVCRGWHAIVRDHMQAVGIARSATKRLVIKRTPSELELQAAHWRRVVLERRGDVEEQSGEILKRGNKVNIAHARGSSQDLAVNGTTDDVDSPPPGKKPVTPSKPFAASSDDRDNGNAAGSAAVGQLAGAGKSRAEYEAEVAALKSMLQEQQKRNEELIAFQAKLEGANS